MPAPTITVAMPFYNSAATLELSIRSLLDQSEGDFELLLCDDGSTDHGLTIARKFRDERVIWWSDGKRKRLAARLNECIDMARGEFLARMDADDIAYPNRLAMQLNFLRQQSEVDLCSGGAMVFGRYGRALWRYSPPTCHAQIVRSPFRGFPLWHPGWMGRTAWFRRWRYDDRAWLAQDQELLLRSYRQSRFANLPRVLLGYRREHVTLKKLLRYKLLHIRYACQQPGHRLSGWQKAQLMAVSSARLGANCVAFLGGTRRLGHQSAFEPTPAELAEWSAVWTQLGSWCGVPLNEAFSASSLLSKSRVPGADA
jgi:glycosyltransferase involved in cell wall biosynthesis